VKDYKSAYNEVIRVAFSSLNGFTHSYDAPAEVQSAVTASFRDDVKTLEKEKEALPGNEKHVEQEATPEVQRYQNREPVPSDIIKQEQPSAGRGKGEQLDEAADTWYAQPIQNGYQLVDNTPKVRMKIFTTSLSNVFIAIQDKGTGLLYLQGSRWLLEYYQGTERRVEEIRIKF
jgi:hypothetical protein